VRWGHPDRHQHLHRHDHDHRCDTELGNSTASGTVVGRIVDNGILRFAHTGPITYAGVISGAGILQKALGNTLTLTGDSTYTG